MIKIANSLFYGSKEAIEYFLLQEIDSLEIDNSHKDEMLKLRDKIQNLKVYYSIYLFVKKIGNNGIFKRVDENSMDRFYVMSDVDTDFLDLDSYSSNKKRVFLIDSKSKSNMFNKVISEKEEKILDRCWNRTDVLEDNMKQDVFDVDKYIKGLEQELERERIQEIKRQKQREKEELERIKGDKKQKEDWEKGEFSSNGDYHFEKVTAKDKVVVISEYERKEYYLLDKPFNELFSIEELNNLEKANTLLSTFELLLQDKKINYIYKKYHDKKLIKKHEVSFKNDKVYVNDVAIPRSKLSFILIRNKGTLTEDNINDLKSLSGIQLDLMNLKEIEFWNNGEIIKIPIEVSYSNKEYTIEFMNKKVTDKWENLVFMKENNRRLRNYIQDLSIFNKFTNSFGLTKQEVFNNLKKLKILMELQNENK